MHQRFAGWADDISGQVVKGILSLQVAVAIQNSNSFIVDLNCVAGLEDNLQEF